MLNYIRWPRKSRQIDTGFLVGGTLKTLISFYKIVSFINILTLSNF